jgi:hypothetical protein
MLRGRWRIAVVGLVAVLLVTAGPAGAASAATNANAAASHGLRQHGTAVGFWAGETSITNYYDAPDYAATFTPAVWQVLQDDRVPIYLNVRYGRDFGPAPAATPVSSDAAAVVNEANRRHVPIYAWLVVPPTDGYWANEDNATLMYQAVQSWAAWSQDQHLRFKGAVLDQEFSLQNEQTFVAAELSGNQAALASWMSGNIDPAGQCRAFKTYHDVITWAHARGIRLSAYQAPFNLDDLLNGDLALQDAFDSSGLPPSRYGGYDGMWVGAYRGAVASFAPSLDPGSYYVASYYERMQRFFPGAPGQVSIGIGGQFPYDTLGPLLTDIQMLAALGAKDVPIYSLETTVQQFGAAGLRTIVEAGRTPLTGSQLAAALAPNPHGNDEVAMDSALDAQAGALTQSKGETPNSYPEGCRDSSIPQTTS